MKVRLPLPVTDLYRAVAKLEALYPSRKFTLDGHLVGSIGEVVAPEALGLTLHPISYRGHDAYDANGDVQIKMTAGKNVAMHAPCLRLSFSVSYLPKKQRSSMTVPVRLRGIVRARQGRTVNVSCL
jgi:hypothetical protein